MLTYGYTIKSHLYYLLLNRMRNHIIRLLALVGIFEMVTQGIAEVGRTGFIWLGMPSGPLHSVLVNGLPSVPLICQPAYLYDESSKNQTKKDCGLQDSGKNVWTGAGAPVSFQCGFPHSRATWSLTGVQAYLPTNITGWAIAIHVILFNQEAASFPIPIFYETTFWPAGEFLLRFLSYSVIVSFLTQWLSPDWQSNLPQVACK